MSSEDDSDRDDFAKSLPTSFGGGSSSFDVNAQIERTRRIPAKKPPTKPNNDSDGASDGSDSDDDSDDEEEDEYPVSHELVFKTHERAVTTITVDPSGSRMITGSTDCTIKLH